MARKKKDTPPKYTRKPVSADSNTLAMSISEFARLHESAKISTSKWRERSGDRPR